MQKHKLRAIIIWAVIVIALINIYPTVGWMCLSDKARQARLTEWKEEDSVYHAPSFWRSTWQGVRRWAQFDRDRVINLGLDLQGGIHMVLGLDLAHMDPEARKQYEDSGWSEQDVAREMQKAALQRIWRRVNEFEAREPVIQALGTDKIQIQLPGERDIDRAKRLITKMAVLTFHIESGLDETNRVFRDIDDHFKNQFVPFLQKPELYREGTYRVPVESFERVRDVIEKAKEVPGLIPEDRTIAFSQKPNPWDKDQEYKIYLMSKEPEMTGDGLKLAVARQDPERPPNWMILFEFAGAASAKFANVTEANMHKNMAIVVDGVVVSAPEIQARIVGSGQITGSFSAEAAKDLAIALNSGSMPVPLREEYTGVVGASLGTDSIRAGVYASIFGLFAVVVFMLVYYRLGGMVANIALLLNGLIMLGAFSYFHLTLTLPGIAGFVLTLGMAVDANVLIFERVREEVRNGKSLVSAIELGYKKATVTILDANITTLIAALVLLQFGTGPVQGFAVALAIGIVTSVFTALVVTQAIFDAFIRRRKLHKLTMMSLIKPDTKIPFIEWRNWAFPFSLALIVVGFVAFFGRGYENNFGVDFASGTNMVVKLDTDRAVDVGEVRQKLDQGGFQNSVVQEAGEGGALIRNEFAIRAPVVPEESIQAGQAGGEASKDIETKVREALASLCGEPADPQRVSLEKVEVVGPAIGTQLRKDALRAVTYAMGFMIAYMWFRYSFVFGLTAVIALLHDTLITLGALAITGRHIDMTVVAGILTIIGYSVNDTVVVYDRIRENLRLYASRGVSYAEIMDLAINQTLGRTLLTSGVTFLAVLMLFIFGGEVLNDFAFYLMVGIVIGTYSSIFVASALAYVWQMWRKRHVPTPSTSRAASRKRPAREERKSKQAVA